MARAQTPMGELASMLRKNNIVLKFLASAGQMVLSFVGAEGIEYCTLLHCTGLQLYMYIEFILCLDAMSEVSLETGFDRVWGEKTHSDARLEFT